MKMLWSIVLWGFMDGEMQPGGDDIVFQFSWNIMSPMSDSIGTWRVSRVCRSDGEESPRCVGNLIQTLDIVTHMVRST